MTALGDARTVLNVGAGAGSYEPEDRYVVAVEPSAKMRAQRRSPAVDATAEKLPFDDDSFDAAMATITIHQWADGDAGLRELRRVSRGPVVILTFDATAIAEFWLGEYVPEVIEAEARRYQPLDHIAAVLGGDVTVSAGPARPRLRRRVRRGVLRPARGAAGSDRPALAVGVGLCRPKQRSSAGSSGCVPTSPRASGTSGTATCAPSPSTSARCG